MQNLLGAGFDVLGLQQQAAQVKAIVADVYDQLKKYDGMKIAPANADSLSKLTQSVKQQAQQMDKLVGSTHSLVTAMKAYTNTVKETAAMNAKLAMSESDVAKANMETKVQLEETNKLMKKNAQETNQLYQERIANEKYEADFKKLLAEEERERKRKEIEDKRKADRQQRELDAQRRRDAKKAQSDQDKIDKEARREREKQAREDEKQRQKEAREALRQSDFYRRLKQREADARKAYGDALGAGADKDTLKRLKTDLSEASGAVQNLEAQFEKASSGGMKNFGKGLSNAFSGVRELAYIIPGLGIAGIFNLAFEAIAKVVEVMFSANKNLDEFINNERELNSTLLEQVQMLDDIQRLWDAIAQTQAGSATDMKQTLSELQAGGANQATILGMKIKIARQELSDINTKIQAEGGEDALRKQVDANRKSILDQEQTYIKSKQIYDKYQLLKDIGIDTKAELLDFAAEAQFIGNEYSQKLLHGLNNAQLKQLQDVARELRPLVQAGTVKDFDVAKATAERDKQVYESTKYGLERGINLLTEYQEKKSAVEEENLASDKFYSDERRKLLLGRAKDDFEELKTATDEVLKNEKSTLNERLNALKVLQKAQDDYYKAQDANIQKDKSASAVEKTLSTENTAQQIAKNESETNMAIAKTTLEWNMKKLEIEKQIAEHEIMVNQQKNKTIMEDEFEFYNTRIRGLNGYIQDRERIAYNQMKKDLAEAKENTPVDLLEAKNAEIIAKYNSKVADIYNGARKDAYNIISSWYKRQLDLIKESEADQQTAVQDAATKELLILNEAYKNKEISYRKFEKTRANITYESQQAINDARVKDLEEELALLQDMSVKLGRKLADANTSLMRAVTEPEREVARGEIQGILEKITENGKKIGLKEDEISKARLKAAEDYNKLQEDAKKQTNANYLELERQLAEGVQQIVDGVFEHRLQRLQELNEAQNEAADREIEAIERSTIAQKEKNAYEVQLTAQKEARDRQLAEQEKKIKHDQAVFDKAIAVSQIIFNTAVAVTGALKIPGAGVALAISYGALGAAQLATALATPIPSYAEGGIHKKDGLAIFGEAGHEMVKEPHKKPWIATRPTLAHLQAGTELIPLYSIPEIPERKNDTWAQTLYLGKQIQKSKREIKNVFRPKIYINTTLEAYKNRIFNG